MNTARRAFTLLEAIIALAIFAGVMAAVLGTMQSGSQLKTAIQVGDSAGNSSSAAVQKVAMALRYADINKIFLDGTDWLKTEGASDYYSFKVCTGFSVQDGGSAASLDRMVQYTRGVILRFSPDPGDAGTATLYRWEFPLSTSGLPPSVEEYRPIATGLAWEFVARPGESPQRGFKIEQLDKTQASVTGNRLMIRAVTFSDAMQGGASTGTSTAIDSDMRPYKLIETAVFLRSSMFDAVGLLPPSITSAATAAGNIGASFIYDITATNDPTSYAAVNLPDGLSRIAGTGRISGTPTKEGTFVIGVSAFNSAGSDYENVTLSIKGPLPVITSANSINVLAGDSVSYQIAADNGPISAFSATGLPAWLTLGSGGLITGKAPASLTTSTTSYATMSAANANGTASEPLTIVASTAPLGPPEILTSGTLSCTVGKPWVYRLEASNNPGAFFADALPSWLLLDGSGLLSGTPPDTGYVNVTVWASNEAGEGAKAGLGIQINDPVPAISSAASASGTVGDGSFMHQLTAINTNSSAVWSLSSDAPAWLVLDATKGTLVGTPTAAGTFAFKVTVANTAASDGAAIGSDTQVLTLEIAPLPPPSVTITSPLSATPEVQLSAQISVWPSFDSFDTGGLPSWLTLTRLSSTSGQLSGTPTAALSNSTVPVEITAINESGKGVAATIINIGQPSTYPVITTPVRVVTTQGSKTTTTWTGTVAAGNGRALAYKTSNPNKGTLLNFSWSVAPSTHSLTLTPATSSSNTFVLTASGDQSAAAIAITVTLSDAGVPALTTTRTFSY